MKVIHLDSEKGIERFAIVRANALDRVAQYGKMFTEITGFKPVYPKDISPIVAMSAGIGTVAIALISKQENL
jgi:hypothetical protein